MCNDYRKEDITVVAHPRGQGPPAQHAPVVWESRVVEARRVVPGTQGQGGAHTGHTEDHEDDDGDEDEDDNKDDAGPQPQVVFPILISWYLVLKSWQFVHQDPVRYTSFVPIVFSHMTSFRFWGIWPGLKSNIWQMLLRFRESF